MEDGRYDTTVHLATLSTLPSQMSFSRADFGCPLDLNMGRFYKRCCIQMKFFPTHRNLFWSVLFSFLSILCASFQSLDKTFPTVPAPCHREPGTVAASSPPPATDWINNKPWHSTWTETCYLLLVRLYSTYNKDVGLSFLPDRCRSCGWMIECKFPPSKGTICFLCGAEPPAAVCSFSSYWDCDNMWCTF